MKKILTIALAATALIPFSGQAQVKADKFPGLAPALQQSARNNMRAPLNQEAKRGAKVFGFTQIDANNYRSFCNWYENEYLMDKLNPIFTTEEENVSRTLWLMNAGAYNHDDGYYYAYRTKYYTIGITYADSWMRVDPTTGKWEIIAALDNHAHDATFIYDLAYSQYDSEMWALLRDTDAIKSRIGRVNLENSEIYEDDIFPLDEYYFAIAFDLEGNCYGIRWDLDDNAMIKGTKLDLFDRNFKVVKSMEVLVDGKPFDSYYQHGLDMDYTTGDLMWSATDYEGNQRMIRLNPDDGKVIKDYGKLPFGEIMLGLYVPYTTAKHREAPAIVKDLAFAIDKNGEQKVTLSWTNPTTTWKREALGNLQNVVIYRDKYEGTPVATIPAAGKEGEAMSWTDEGTTTGVHTYYVMGVNEKGEGVQTSIEAYVGKDAPGPVRDVRVTAEDNGRAASIRWGRPKTGDSEGWYNTSTVKYDIVRNPGNKTIATDLTATNYKDVEVDEAQYYTYTVTAHNEEGRGTPVESEGILVGNSVKIPFTSNLMIKTEADRFTSFDTGGNKCFYFDFNPMRNGINTVNYSLQQGGNNDATLVSPPLNVTKGKTYHVKFIFDINRFDGDAIKEVMHHFALTHGTEATHDGMQKFADFDNYRTVINRAPDQEVDGYFTAPVDGDYYVGLQVLSNVSFGSSVYVTGFEITEAPDNDLAAVSLKTPKAVSSDNANNFEVTVYNNGSNDQSNYKVQIGYVSLDNKFTSVGETAEVPAVKSHESVTVKVPVATANYSGIQDIAALVVLEGDGYEGNNRTGLTEVNVEAGDAFNYSAEDPESEWHDTHAPAYFYSTHSATQTIYTRDMLNFDQDENVITGLAWRYTSNDSFTDEIKAEQTVYLNKTSQATYSNKNFLDRGKEVFKGEVRYTEGEDNWAVVRFPDNGFTLGKDENLVVTVVNKETLSNGGFPILFSIFNSPNAGIDTCDGLNHTLVAYGNSEISFSQAANNSETTIPVLYLATLGDRTGVDTVIGAEGFEIRYNRGMLLIDGETSAIEVYDLSGRRTAIIDSEGRDAVALDLGRGVYIVKATAKNGLTKAIKVVK